jgi:hypothetical protein
MRVGYYVQGAADEAFVWGLVGRWCPHTQMAEGKFRGSSRTSFRREIEKALWDLRDDKRCDVLVVLTDSDVAPWREVRKREWNRVPEDCRHLCVYGVAERNIECWLAVDRVALARELRCEPHEIPSADPAGFVKRRFGLGERDTARDDAKDRVKQFVCRVPMKPWIDGSESFRTFYTDCRALAAQLHCEMPNEMEST